MSVFSFSDSGVFVMLLFSTLLDIEDSLTPDDFIRLVIEWNQRSPHGDNVISPMVWRGERNIRFGSDDLWLEFREDEERQILAARYEKRQDNGVIWDTDYVMNFGSRKMAIQLDRSFEEDAAATDLVFSTPHFLTSLIERGYLMDDEGLPIDRKPLVIDEGNLPLIADVMNGKVHYRLPVVYISRKFDGRLPVNAGLLASKLKGIAHVLMQESTFTNRALRQMVNDQNEYGGSIGIYYPRRSLGHKRCWYREYPGSSEELLNRVVRSVMLFSNSLTLDPLYTWQGVNNDIFRNMAKAQREARRAEADESSELWQSYEEEAEELRQKLEDMTHLNERLQAENQGLRSRLETHDSEPVLYMGDEEDFYPGEIRDFLLEVLSEALKNMPEQSRKRDVISDILQKNPYEGLGAGRDAAVKKLLKNYTGLTGRLRQSLEDLGFVITEQGKHYKVTYYGDGRYMVVFGKTPSDFRSGKNNSGKLCKKCF